MNLKRSFVLFLMLAIIAGITFSQVGTGLDSGVYVRESDFGKESGIVTIYIGPRIGDGSCLVSYQKENRSTVWEGRGIVNPQHKRYLGVYFGAGSVSTYDFEILSSTSFKWGNTVWKLASM